MPKTQNQELERLSLTIPASLAREVEWRIEAGHYARVAEWIRHAIREQIQRESDAFDRLVAEDPRVLASFENARQGKSRESLDS